MEREVEPGVFHAVEGPVRSYRRQVDVSPRADGRFDVTTSTEFRLGVPYVGWVFLLPVRAVLRRPPGAPGAPQPWWAPPERLDARGASVLGVLAAASVVSGYLGTLITQTITFAADEFGDVGDRAQSTALAALRPGVLLALVLLVVADRRGRRRVLVLSAAGGCILAATGALVPSLAWLTASQLVARIGATVLAELIVVFAAEEMPKGSRAYAVSVLGMSAATGAGVCVMALPLADIGPSAWRVLYVLPLLALPLCRDIARRLPESRRFLVRHRRVPFAGHGGRLVLLATSGFLLAMFATPASQLQNEFLRDERGYSALAISAFTLVTNTPGGIGVVVGGRLADVRGRRTVAAVAIVGGVAGTTAQFLTAGSVMWASSLVGAVIGGATLPALVVYGPELFPTSLRGRANGLIRVSAVAGSGAGLLLAGELSDRLGSLGGALRLLALGPAIVVVLVLVLYPETANRELEDLNPEDPHLGRPGLPPT